MEAEKDFVDFYHFPKRILEQMIYHLKDKLVWSLPIS